MTTDRTVSTPLICKFTPTTKIELIEITSDDEVDKKDNTEFDGNKFFLI